MNRISSFHKLIIKLSMLCFLLVSSCTEEEKQQSYLLENVNLIDGTGAAVQAGKSIWIEDDRIKAILDHNSGDIPKDLQKIDLHGKYILPGLIDSHVHFGTDPADSDSPEATKKRLAQFLQHGITGVRDMAGDTRHLASIARLAELDEIASPDIYYSSLMAGKTFFSDPRTVASARGETPGEAAWMKAIEEDTDIALAVAEAKGTGATGIKIYADLPAHLCQKIIVEAQKQNFKVWAHAAVLPALPMDLAMVGINSLSHAPLLAWQVSDRVPDGARNRYDETALDVNLPDFQILLGTMAANEVYLDPTIKIFLGRPSLYNNSVEATKAAFAAGVLMVVGTDMTMDHENVEYFPLIDEMQVLVDVVGMPASEVIKAATLNPAKLLGIENEVGSIAVGKKANLIVVKNNPLEDIIHLNKVDWVIKNGKRVK